MKALGDTFGFALVLGLVAACGNGNQGSPCVPGASVACAGPGGCAGGQVCSGDGSRFGSCVCGGGSAGPGGSSRIERELGIEWKLRIGWELRIRRELGIELRVERRQCGRHGLRAVLAVLGVRRRRQHPLLFSARRTPTEVAHGPRPPMTGGRSTWSRSSVEGGRVEAGRGANPPCTTSPSIWTTSL